MTDTFLSRHCPSLVDSTCSSVTRRGRARRNHGSDARDAGERLARPGSALRAALEEVDLTWMFVQSYCASEGCTNRVSQAGMDCKACRNAEGYKESDKARAAREKEKASNALKNPINYPINNAKTAAKLVATKKRTFEEMKGEGSLTEGQDNEFLTNQELRCQIIEALKSHIRLLHQAGNNAERDSLLGVLLGINAFNVTMSANHRRHIEHWFKMARPDPPIVKAGGGKLGLEEYNALIKQVPHAKCTC